MRKHNPSNEQGACHPSHYDAASTNDRIIIHLRNLSHTMRCLYEGKGSQKRILIVLYELGGSLSQRELTERLGIQPGSVSEVVAKLEDGGYIQRVPCQTDRRSINLTLTPSGRQLAKQAKEQRLHRHEEMFSCLDESEKQELLVLLEKINQDWSDRYQSLDEHHGPHGHGSHGHGGKPRHKGE